RMLLETIRAVRRRVGPRFPVAIKLNSADFQRGGFAFDDCLRLVEMINEEGLDLLEISGGSYEQPQLFGMQGAQETAVTNSSTAKREAYFLEYAEQVRAIARMPVMVTGGFRSRSVMAAAIQTGATDVIGLGRPMCSDPDVAGKLIRADVDEADRFERTLKAVGPKALWPLQLLGQQAWFGAQIQRMARGLAPRLSLKPLTCFMNAQVDEFTRAALLARRSPTLVREEPNYAGN
ncbi:MAG: hypothetical protein PHS60_14795, partial [Zavarzinia sp.]|nr:hypothetical protein [Zavarzinia sp.]